MQSTQARANHAMDGRPAPMLIGRSMPAYELASAACTFWATSAGTHCFHISG